MSDSTMSNQPDSRIRVIHGVDFSGADAGGEAGIRIASRPCVAESVVDRIERLDRTGLRRRILASLDDGHDHLWLIDAPFGLPLATLEACGIPKDWSKTVEWMASFRTPRDWRRGVRGVTRKEPRRLADRAAATPLASMNLRIFKQTWTAMVELLRPLAEAGVRIEPLAGPRDSRVVVAEGCPASILKRGGDSSRGYKGKDASNRDRRREILEVAHHRWGLRISETVAGRCIDGTAGDDLDAVILTLDPLVTVVPPEASVEGWVYS
ncbi:MAG: DUF429 domain-containing protein [Phycisphaerales bacterium]|nr:DUF429 domain-containing protein [Phycisphaerales bacterium]